MATRFISNGPELQVNQAPGQDGIQNSPDVAVLSDGRFLVVFRDVNDIGGQFFNANGTLSGPSLVAGNAVDQIGLAAGNQELPAVAARLGGAAVVVWLDGSVGNGDIEVTILNSAGGEITPGTELNVNTGTTGAADFQTTPDVATLSDGRSLIVWHHFDGVDFHVEARILEASGALAAGDRIVVEGGPGIAGNAVVAADQSNKALVAYVNDELGNFDVWASVFNGTSFETPFVVVNKSSQVNTLPDVAALADNRYVIVYEDISGNIFFKIYDPSTPDGAFLGPEIEVTSPTAMNATQPTVAGTLDGGFVVSWFQNTGAPNVFDIFQRRYDAHGLPYGEELIVNTLRDGAQQFPALASSGVNVLTVWQDSGTAGRADTAPTGLRGQAFTGTAFDYDSARFGDFDNDGRDDILFQNDTGALTLWRTNSSAVLSSIDPIGALPAGFRIDGTGNFNSTPGDDILLRSPTQVAVLPMNGTAAQPVQVLGGTSADFLNAGMGDMTGDGQADLLFRNVNTNQIVTWGVANNALSTAPNVLGSTSAQFQIVALDDFTGDAQSDILFRDTTNGDIAIWRIANNALAGAPAVIGSTSTAFHVVGVGDFDGNASNDILFRNDNGDVVMWLLNAQGQLLGAPQLVGTVSLAFHVEGTGDMNGDNRSDIIFRHADGTVVQWLMNGAALAAPPSVLGSIPVDHAIAAHHFDLV